MLEELDHLEQRIRSLVDRLRLQEQERASLRLEVEDLRQQRDSLMTELAESRKEVDALRGTVGKAESIAQQEKEHAQKQVSQLQGTLDLFVVEKEAIQADLLSREKEVARLRTLTREAQARIEGVLERLPGAQAQGQQ